MLDVSFIIPTCRNFNKYAKNTTDSILKSNFDFNFEIIICSKEPIKYCEVNWIEEPSSNNGSVLPINISFNETKGKYVALLNDDFDISNNFANVLEFLKKYSKNKLKV